MKSGHLYYASDKAVYDALVQHNFKSSDVREIFLSRGILISDDTPREDVAHYFSMLNHDYYDHQKIAGIFFGATRKERTALTKVSASFDKEKLDYVAHELKRNLESEGAKVECKWAGKNYEIHIKYEDYNSNKSEFKQTVEKEAVIEIEAGGEGFLVRYPNNKFVSEAKDRLLDVMSKQMPEQSSLVVDEISLKVLVSSGVRTDFFKKLLTSLSGYKPVDVSDVYVYNPKIKNSDTDVGIHITKVSLKGEGVLSSVELDGLFKTGFYITRMVWTCVAQNDQSDIYELDAQFNNLDDCEGFSYVVRGVFKYNGKGGHNKTKTACDPLPDKKMLRLLESAAHKALQEVKGGDVALKEVEGEIA